nr:aldehyde ferredoxin oxidoreductase N-terminal domain-containing protein [Spirochaetota bacterium]
MIEIIGAKSKILEINLSNQSVNRFIVSENDLRLYLGGKGLGLKLIYDRMDLSTDPFDEKNILAFAMGVMLGTGAPCTGRWSCVTKSPLTGIMVSSSCGGHFGMALKTAGVDGILISGKSDKPVYLEISDDDVKFIDASFLWGKSVSDTQKELNLSKDDGACVIGPAGENLVLYANIASGHRFLGRGGIGAVMGSKKLKAIVAKGKKYSIKPKNEKLFKKIKDRSVKFINRNKFTSVSYRTYGTTYNLNICNKNGILPVNNFSGRTNPEAYKVSGEVM